jgi:hypothetical protein
MAPIPDYYLDLLQQKKAFANPARFGACMRSIEPISVSGMS